MDNHPINPPSELINQWETLYFDEEQNLDVVLIQAYQAGADQELEACEKWLSARTGFMDSHDLHNARRLKPPSLKQQAQRILVENGTTLDGRIELEPEDIITISRALAALPDE